MKHDLYTDADTERPREICDRNWSVVLDMCKRCNKAESELWNLDGSASNCIPEESPTAQPNPWHPMSNPVDLKVMGKLAEETNELGSAIARCIIQGIDECHPETGKSNRQWIEEELADMQANVELAQERFGFKIDPERVKRKKAYQTIWHNQA